MLKGFVGVFSTPMSELFLSTIQTPTTNFARMSSSPKLIYRPSTFIPLIPTASTTSKNSPTHTRRS